MRRRGSGVLCHLTSLPSPFGLGDLGPGAFAFVDWLAEAGQSYWQVLPLSPTDSAFGHSPYHSPSALAGNPLLISPERLMAQGLLPESLRDKTPEFPARRAEYDRAAEFKAGLFKIAHQRFRRKKSRHYSEFLAQEAGWLDDFALFKVLKDLTEGVPWTDWPAPLRDRRPRALKAVRDEHFLLFDLVRFEQYLFSRQWAELKAHAAARGVNLIGDAPIYVTLDSCDAWVNPHLFKLDRRKRPLYVAGVPPDYFSATGQLWGNPVYDWVEHQRTGFEWWLRRVGHNLRLYDFLRIDHFRGLVAFWEVPAGEETALNGAWVEAPAVELLAALVRKFPHFPLIAEDLGVITPEVREVMAKFDLPGMKILLFSLDDFARNPYAPHNLPRNCLIYTGTHDNNTARGWWQEEATPEQKEILAFYLGHPVQPEEVHWDFIRLALASVADTAIVPLQDILGLDQTGRMNRPSTQAGNWTWRATWEEIKDAPARRLRRLAELCGRV